MAANIFNSASFSDMPEGPAVDSGLSPRPSPGPAAALSPRLPASILTTRSGSGDAMHSFSQDELAAFTKFINEQLQGDADLAGDVPMNPATPALFDVVAKSVLLAYALLSFNSFLLFTIGPGCALLASVRALNGTVPLCPRLPQCRLLSPSFLRFLLLSS